MNNSSCTPKTYFFGWNETYANVLLALAILGALLTLIGTVISLTCWNTPMVRASVGPISLLSSGNTLLPLRYHRCVHFPVGCHLHLVAAHQAPADQVGGS